jgi:hypothetical protein
VNKGPVGLRAPRLRARMQKRLEIQVPSTPDKKTIVDKEKSVLNRMCLMAIRRALLIGSNNMAAATGGALGGVSADIAHMAAFLRSDEGGAWNDDEIFADDKSWANVHGFLTQNRRVDLLWVFYAGHGAIDANTGKSYVKFPGTNILVEDLANWATKQVTIIDACRFPVQLSQPLTKIAGATVGLGGIPQRHPRAVYRQTYEDAFLRCTGRALMQSCSPREYAGDMSGGGVYTTALLNLASETANSQTSSTLGPVRVGSMANPVRLRVTSARPSQTPTFEHSESGNELPFMVY